MQPCPFTITSAKHIAVSDTAMCVSLIKPRYGINVIKEYRGRMFVKIPMGKIVCYADITEAFAAIIADEYEKYKGR